MRRPRFPFMTAALLMPLLATAPVTADRLAILWDDAHDDVTPPLEAVPDDLAGAGQYSEFAAMVAAEGHSMTEWEGPPGSLTAATLALYDVLMVFDAEAAFTATELTNIQAFVANGGFVFINGDRPGAFNRISHNTLLAPYGVTFTLDDFLEPCSPPAIPCNVEPTFDLTVFNADPLTAGLKDVDLNSSGSLAVSGAGTKILGSTSLGHVGYAYGADGAVVVLADADTLSNVLLFPGDDGEKLVRNLLRHWGGEPPAIEITIEIKPGSVINPVNPDSNGVIPVAIVTTNTAAGDAIDFDPWDSIDVTTLAFGPSLAPPAREASAEDADADGDVDMVLQFKTQETGVQCGDTELGLTATTHEGETVTGADSITTTGCK